MAGTERRVSRVWNDGAAYDMVVPEPVAGLAGVPVMTAVAERMRALDALAARPGTRAQVRALLGVECLSSRQLTRMSAGGPAGSRPVGDGQLRRFTRACAAGVAAGQLGPAELRRAHRAVVPGGGTVRSGTVWVGGVPTPSRAEFVPPPPEDLGRLLADLGAFLMRDDLCPVAQTAIGYAQLVMIHPFRDGNGRVGRWLLQVMPRRRGLVHELVAPMGLYFLANAQAYMAAHAAFRAGGLERWCSFFGDAVIRCSAATEQFVGSSPGERFGRETGAAARGAAPEPTRRRGAGVIRHPVTAGREGARSRGGGRAW